MSADAKPLLVIFTDCASSLIHFNEWRQVKQTRAQIDGEDQFGAIDKSIHKLHLNDTRVITIDLQSENKCT